MSRRPVGGSTRPKSSRPRIASRKVDAAGERVLIGPVQHSAVACRLRQFRAYSAETQSLEGGALANERVERRLTAILAADVAGYSGLMGADEEGTLAQLKACRRELIDPKIATIADASSRPPVRGCSSSSGVPED